MEAGDDTVAAIDSGPAVEGVGAMLRARRVELGLSQADVANMVKLPPRRIEAMELERWNELPDGPYLRGFLRNVARALNLDATPLLSRVDASLGVATTTTRETTPVRQGVTHATLPRRSGPADDRRGGRALVYGAFVFAMIAALIAWSGTASFDHAVALVQGTIAPTTQAGAKPGTKPPVEAVGERAPTEAGPVAASNASSGAPSTAPSTTSSTTAPPTAEAAVQSTAPAVAPAIALSFHFNEDSWVEVKAADGRVLLQRLNAAGSEQAVDGEAPFSLIVGNAKGVALRFRGQPVDLAPYTRDSVARFTLS